MQTSRPFALIASIAVFSLGSTACNDDPGPSTGSPPPSSPSTGTTPEETTGSDTDRLDLLFQRADTRRNHVAWVGLDGSYESAPLAEFGDGAQTNPDWSPDGTRFVFAMVDGTTDDLFVAVAGAPEATKLLDCVAPCLYLDDPAWSPDGSTIVYSRTVDRDGHAASTLEVVDVASGKVSVLLGPWTEQFTAGARWSPNGRRIVFEMVSKTGPELEADLSGVTLSVLRLESTKDTVRSVTDPAVLAADGLTDPALFAATADWSPDGQWIVYSALAAPEDEAPELFRIGALGGPAQRLTQLVDAGGYAAEPTFGPDGTRIVFSGGRSADEVDLLLQVDADGTGLALATGDVEVHGRHPRVRAALSVG